MRLTSWLAAMDDELVRRLALLFPGRPRQALACEIVDGIGCSSAWVRSVLPRR